jgi:hypothetical protein
MAYAQCTIVLITGKTIVQHSGEVDLFSTYTIFYVQLCTYIET